MENKKVQLREDCKNIRKQLDITSCSNSIVNNIKEWIIYKKAKNIMIFYPINTEINLLELIKNNDKKFYFPKVKDNEIYPVLYTNKDCFETGKYNIPEAKGEVLNNLAILDLIFVPALAADQKGFRLGYGKGYYDRFISSKGVSAISVIPIHSKLFFNKIPYEEHDKKCNYIITENNIFET